MGPPSPNVVHAPMAPVQLSRVVYEGSMPGLLRIRAYGWRIVKPCTLVSVTVTVTESPGETVEGDTETATSGGSACAAGTDASAVPPARTAAARRRIHLKDDLGVI